MADSVQYMLTTVDNPWSPFDNYDEWYEYDRSNGYHTPSLLARIANTSLDLSDSDYVLSLKQAMDEIVQLNVSGMHTIVSR